MDINFNFEDVEYELPDEKSLVDWISYSIKNENFIPCKLSYIFCSDEYLWKMNKQFLEHDYYTDIITFDYVEGDNISGDMFISIDRIKDNANKFNVSCETELLRVMIHGVMHLVGYDDLTDEQEAEIHKKEDFYIDVYNNKFKK
jgi:rRNA maturation RNase YbeY